MRTHEIGVDRGGHVHPYETCRGPGQKVKPQVTTQIAHPRVRGGSVLGVDMSTPVHPSLASVPDHGTTRVQPVRAAIAARKEDDRG